MHSTATESMNELLHAIAEETNAALGLFVNSPLVPDNMREPVSYAVLGPGKRLRPILTLLSADAAGGPRTAALPPAIALELIHAFSLVHDDLPAMDDDDLRRGRPTLHIHAGEAMAVLTGDVLVSLAISHIAHAPFRDGIRLAIIREISDATSEMIEGQVYDTLGGFEADDHPRKRMERIHALKTGALIKAACRCGALAVGAPQESLDALTHYGHAIGLMFQAVDDLLDETQTTEHLGKASGKDKNLGKLTAPEVLGLDGTRERIASLERTAREALMPLGDAARPLIDLCAYLANRTR